MLLSELAKKLQAGYEGDGSREISGIGSLQDAGPADITFLTDDSYASLVVSTKAAGVVVPQDFAVGGTEAVLLRVADVDAALDSLLELFAPVNEGLAPGVHPTAWVHPSVKLGKDVAVGPQAAIHENVIIGRGTTISSGCVIGHNVSIGEECQLWPNVVINHRCILGNRVIINANSTIGTDGFGYRPVDGHLKKIAHIGTVVIEDDVEIGANCCVDRAKFGQTVIGSGTKIDNLVQVAHNVQIGRDCILVAQVGIAGSSRLGNHVIIAGQSGISDHVVLEDGVMVGPKSAVTNKTVIKANSKVVGLPVQPIKTYYRQLALFHKLPQLAQDIKQIKKQLKNRVEPTDNS